MSGSARPAASSALLAEVAQLLTVGGAKSVEISSKS
jgi:hypothetical protein